SSGRVHLVVRRRGEDLINVEAEELAGVRFVTGLPMRRRFQTLLRPGPAVLGGTGGDGLDQVALESSSSSRAMSATAMMPTRSWPSITGSRRTLYWAIVLRASWSESSAPMVTGLPSPS